MHLTKSKSEITYRGDLNFRNFILEKVSTENFLRRKCH